ncbi:hypothetical protein [Methylocella silvestris]|uniref:Uncharacterized protein n=1 Tax=Methylocella silvestris TaxID=199596 RepID=A0A2J7TG31_METSI|nr:hypothetical protein [Methylocella silvestris]PNG25718.1 hypothetical protein CR492_12435 [Methylocella silvestris]
MPNDTVPAAVEGLPNSDMNPPSGLAENPAGLAVIRSQSIKALRPSMLSGEELDRFLVQLDEYSAALQMADHVREKVSSLSDPRWPALRKEIGDQQEKAAQIRRYMKKPITAIRTARSKTIDDILFKAVVVEIIEPYDCVWSKTLGHSIVNDLLSAACEWRA